MLGYYSSSNSKPAYTLHGESEELNRMVRFLGYYSDSKSKPAYTLHGESKELNRMVRYIAWILFRQ